MKAPLWRRCTVVFLLALLSFLNGTDRYTMAGLLKQISEYYKLDDSSAGLISTLYTVIYVVVSPALGFFADRYTRKWICLGACVIWIIAMLASSIVPASAFWLFITLRALTGIGTAAVDTIGPVFIADLFDADGGRGYAFMVYYYALPFGWSASTTISSHLVASDLPWQWGLRFIAPAAAATVVLLGLLSREPEKQISETSEDTFWKDCKAILRVRTFWLTVLAISAVNMVTGAQGWWNPYMLQLAHSATNQSEAIFHGESYPLMMTIVGIDNTAGGIAGTTVAVAIAERWSTSGILCLRPTPRAFSLVGGIGTLCSTCTTLFVQHLYLIDVNWNYVVGFIGSIFCFGAFALAMTNIMSVIPTRRRATATAVYHVIASLVGDAPSSTIVGKVADALRPSFPDPGSDMAHLKALLNAFYVTNSTMAIAAISFFLSALTIPSEIIHEKSAETEQRPDGSEESAPWGSYGSMEKDDTGRFAPTRL